jgi:hypothetical protein
MLSLQWSCDITLNYGQFSVRELRACDLYVTLAGLLLRSYWSHLGIWRMFWIHLVDLSGAESGSLLCHTVQCCCQHTNEELSQVLKQNFQVCCGPSERLGLYGPITRWAYLCDFGHLNTNSWAQGPPKKGYVHIQK